MGTPRHPDPVCLGGLVCLRQNHCRYGFDVLLLVWTIVLPWMLSVKLENASRRTQSLCYTLLQLQLRQLPVARHSALL